MRLLSIFSYAFNAVAPILILVFIGYLLNRKQVFDKAFFKKVNTFAFHYCFPPLMFTNLYSLGSIRDIDLHLAGVLMGAVITITLLGFVVANVMTNVKNRKGVLIQAAFRSNFAVIGLPLVEGLCGAEGLALAAAMQAPTVIYFNVASVLCLAIYSDDAKIDWKKVARNVLHNPMVQGLSVGLVALVVREFIPLRETGDLVFSIERDLPWFYTTLKYLGRMGTPLCLIALGGQFSFSDVGGVKKELITGTLMRLIIAPMIGFSFAALCVKAGFISLTPAAVGIFIAGFGSPIATSSAVMATEMHGDDVLAGQIVVWTCLFSMITVFLMTVGFRAAGLL